MANRLVGHVEITTLAPQHLDKVLTEDALHFIEELHHRFNAKRKELLQKRVQRQKLFDSGQSLDFLKETEAVRNDPTWSIAPIPSDLANRKVEITGPVERKMMINALNSGAKVFMADFEDSLSPTWVNVIDGQANLMDAVNRQLEYVSPEGKKYALNDKLATLMVRPRGWHLPEKHLLIDHEPVSASLFDFGLYFFHNAKQLIANGTAPYFYLPKMESHLEARLWNEVFIYAQEYLKIPRGKIRATVLIETIPAAFEMEEILFELKEHSAGLNAGRWDYLFSIIKRFKNHQDLLFPDRVQVNMTVPFMRAYATLLVSTCHKRGAHAMGGMAAFIPSRKDAAINARALEAVREDKLREVEQGFDGTWVAHPDLVPVALEIFDQALGEKDNQINAKSNAGQKITTNNLLNFEVFGGSITEAGLRLNIGVALQYIACWLSGLGAVAIFNLMEDAATAEISRAQIWQWVHHPEGKLNDGRKITVELVEEIAEEERQKVLVRLGAPYQPHIEKAWAVLKSMTSQQQFEEFLTLVAYKEL